MFTDDEIDAAGRPGGTGPRRPRREAHVPVLFELEPPFVTVGDPPPVSEWPAKATTGERPDVGTVLSGIAGLPGRGERAGPGRSLDPVRPDGLEPGDILVAPITDPAWTPLFVPAAAVVVDVGAQITHAVIVSRGARASPASCRSRARRGRSPTAP